MGVGGRYKYWEGVQQNEFSQYLMKLGDFFNIPQTKAQFHGMKSL